MNNSTQTKAPSVSSIIKKLFGTTKKLGNTTVVVLDTCADVISDTVDLTTTAVAAAPECIKEATNLPKYSKAGYLSSESQGEGKESLTFEDALSLVKEESLSVEDVFKALGNSIGSIASSTKSAFNEED